MLTYESRRKPSTRVIGEPVVYVKTTGKEKKSGGIIRQDRTCFASEAGMTPAGAWWGHRVAPARRRAQLRVQRTGATLRHALITTIPDIYPRN